MMMLLMILLAAPAWTPAATHRTPSGKTVDCKALRATPPGAMMGALQKTGAHPTEAFGALETCLAEGPHLCDRAWVGHAIFGVSMAVVDGVAPPIAQRKAWFDQVCRRFTPAEQRCLLLSSVDMKRMESGQDACGPTRDRLRKALIAAQVRAAAATSAASGPAAP